MIDYYQRQANTLSGWISDLFADDTNMDKAKREAQDAQEWADVIIRLVEPAERLEAHLESVETF